MGPKKVIWIFLSLLNNSVNYISKICPIILFSSSRSACFIHASSLLPILPCEISFFILFIMAAQSSACMASLIFIKRWNSVLSLSFDDFNLLFFFKLSPRFFYLSDFLSYTLYTLNLYWVGYSPKSSSRLSRNLVMV